MKSLALINPNSAWLGCFMVLMAAAPSGAAQAVVDSERTNEPVVEQQEKPEAKTPGNSPNDSEQFMRVRKDAEGRDIALETSITRFEKTNEDGDRITIDLIGVVHIGEKDYYEILNKRFRQYEGVLFELVAPKGTVIPKGGRREQPGLNPVAALQKAMQSMLGLEFQLDHIDYTKKNLIHADMSPEEFAESMRKNEESILKYALRAIGQAMAMQSKGKRGSENDILRAMFSGNHEIKMRQVFASQMQDMEAGMIIFQGKDGSTIIDHRNAKCMEVLERELENGKTNLAIFYGAGHLPDMQQRLEKDFQMKRGGQNWLRAWSLEVPKGK